MELQLTLTRAHTGLGLIAATQRARFQAQEGHYRLRRDAQGFALVDARGTGSGRALSPALTRRPTASSVPGR